MAGTLIKNMPSRVSWVVVVMAVQVPATAFGGDGQTDAVAGQTTTTVTGGIASSTGYNDNIYARRTLRTPDGIFVVAPSLNIAVKNERSSLNFGGEGEVTTYAENSQENTQDYKVYANGLYKFSPSFVVSGGASHERTHEDRASADEVFGDRPTIYWVSRAYAASMWRYTGGSFKVGGTFDRFDFRDVNAGAAVVNNDDRDHDISTAGARLGFDLNNQNEIFGNFTYDGRDYRSRLDDAGFDRDSNGVRASAGWRYHPNANFDYEAYLGWIYQTHDDNRFKDISTLDFGHRMTWRPVAGTTIEGFSDRRVIETTLVGSSSYLQTASGVNIYHWPRPDVRLNAGASYYRNDYQDVDRVDSIWALNLGIRHYFKPNWYYGLSYNFTSRDSTDIRENYDRNEFMLRLVRQPTEAYAPGDLSAPAVAHVRNGGIYVGAKIGHVNTATKLEGPRENGTTVDGTCLTGGCLQADFGDHGLAGGVFGGYGVNIADWYVGAELDATFADAGWNHARQPGGRIFSTERDAAYGASVIVGRSMIGGTMLYARAGAVVADFETVYQTGNRVSSTTHSELGLRAGVGGLVPLSARMALRLEHDFTAYSDYAVAYPSGIDRFANNETATWLGLLYRLQPAEAASFERSVDFGGFYIGAQVGHGVVASTTTGDRAAGSVLTADFSDDGLTGGIFVGYGHQLGRVYLGVEGEAEYGDVHWDHERDPSGRSFSVTKKEGYGAGLRLGYVANNSALIYGRVGLVQTNFEAAFKRGNNVLVEDKRASGVRYGMGLELPMSERAVIRLDYTFTSYDAFQVVVPPAGDAERYETTESLFRLGTALRF